MLAKTRCGLVHFPFIPLLFLVSLAGSPVDIIVSQYTYQWYSEEAGLDPKNSSFQDNTDCTKDYNLTKDTVQDHVQQQAAHFSMLLVIALNVPTMFAMPLWGALSDRVGRKVPVVIAIFGNMIRALSILFTIALNLPVWVILIGEFIHGLCGYNDSTIYYVTCAYIADNCRKDRQPIEMYVAKLWSMLAYTVGLLLTGFLLKDVGYTYIIGVASGLDFILMFYTILIVPKFGNPARVSLEEHRSFRQQFKMSITQTAKVLFCAKQYKIQLSILLVFVCLRTPGSVLSYTCLNYIAQK